MLVTGMDTEGATHFDSKTFPTKCYTGDIDAESDCESDCIEAEECTEAGNDETRVVLSPGSHSA